MLFNTESRSMCLCNCAVCERIADLAVDLLIVSDRFLPPVSLSSFRLSDSLSSVGPLVTSEF